MSGLWTPDGDRPQPDDIERAANASVEPGSEERPPLSEEEQALLDELAHAESELLTANVADVVANHCYGLFQLAALHLGQQPPHLDDARLAIDALAAIVDGLGERLGGGAETLRDGLAQIRLAYVQISSIMGAGSGANGATPAE